AKVAQPVIGALAKVAREVLRPIARGAQGGLRLSARSTLTATPVTSRWALASQGIALRSASAILCQPLVGPCCAYCPRACIVMIQCRVILVIHEQLGMPVVRPAAYATQ